MPSAMKRASRIVVPRTWRGSCKAGVFQTARSPCAAVWGTDVLVSDRFAFARDYPGIPVDRATIEDYMTLALKGEPLKEVQ